MFHVSRRRWRLFCCLRAWRRALLLAAAFQALGQTSPILTTISEVRWSDSGWGQFADENLAGRFTTQTFTLPRLTKVQDYFLRQFDGSTPPKYSRRSAALHVDYPY